MTDACVDAHHQSVYTYRASIINAYTASSQTGMNATQSPAKPTGASTDPAMKAMAKQLAQDPERCAHASIVP